MGGLDFNEVGCGTKCGGRLRGERAGEMDLTMARYGGAMWLSNVLDFGVGGLSSCFGCGRSC